MEVPVVCPKCEIPACGKHCLSRKKQPPYGPCVKVSGQGTDHKGFGNCSSHGGSTETGKKHAKTLRQEAWDRIIERADPSLSRMIHLADHAESESVQFQANKDILDRAGLGPKHVHEHTGPNGGPIPVEVRSAKLLERARALRPPASDSRSAASRQTKNKQPATGKQKRVRNTARSRGNDSTESP